MNTVKHNVQGAVWRVPTDTRELMLALDPSRVDVPQPAREAAAQWAQQWMLEQPDATIVMGCNARARNRDDATRQLRLRRLQSTLQRHGVPADRILSTDAPLQTPVCQAAGERGVAWLKVLEPMALEKCVMSVESLFEMDAPNQDCPA